MRAKLLLCSLALSLGVAGTVHAGPEFPRVAIANTTAVPAEPYRAWLDQLRAHAAAGRLAAGSGDHAAKVLVLSHVSPGFTCERDFGGVCGGETPLERLGDFLRRAGHWEPVPGLPENWADPAAWEGVDLSAVNLEIGPLLAPLEEGASGYCTAELTPRSADRFQAAIDALMSDPSSGISDELMAWFRLNGLLGRWNIRAAPDIAAPVVGQAENELVFFPGEGPIEPQVQTLPDGRQFGWYAVSLFDGTDGFVAVDRASLMTSLDARFCISIEAGRPVIDTHIGGGD